MKLVCAVVYSVVLAAVLLIAAPTVAHAQQPEPATKPTAGAKAATTSAPATPPAPTPKAASVKIDTSRTWVVGTKVAAPFAMKRADGSWFGLSITLWENIAKRLGIKFRWKERTLKQLISEPGQGKLDVAIAAITITAKREQAVDFTHPFHTTGLGIAIPNKTGASSWAFFKKLFSLDFLKIMLFLFLLLTGVGLLVWLFERRRNKEQFGGSTAEGIGNGLWFSAVTMTTVGYGDKAPVSLGGRLVALVWMFASIIIISSFTAAITTTLTVSSLESSIKGPEDLKKTRVGTVAGSSSDAWLKKEGITVRYYKDIKAALGGVAKGEVGAAVYDAPLIKYLVKKHYTRKVRVLGRTFKREDYGIALPNGSPIRERVNQAIMEEISRPTWRALIKKYLGG